jgi:hypothetical protein
LEKSYRVFSPVGVKRQIAVLCAPQADQDRGRTTMNDLERFKDVVADGCQASAAPPPLVKSAKSIPGAVHKAPQPGQATGLRFSARRRTGDTPLDDLQDVVAGGRQASAWRMCCLCAPHVDRDRGCASCNAPIEGSSALCATSICFPSQVLTRRMANGGLPFHAPSPLSPITD